jgi:hypothetical protein
MGLALGAKYFLTQFNVAWYLLSIEQQRNLAIGLMVKRCQTIFSLALIPKSAYGFTGLEI